MELHEAVLRVESRDDLARFLRAAASDLIEHPEEWENDKLETFLLGLAGWVEDSRVWFSRQGIEEPDAEIWSLMAHMMMAGRVYE